MRSIWASSAVLAVLLGQGAARAGLYNTAEEPPRIKPTQEERLQGRSEFDVFQETLSALRRIPQEQPPESVLRKRYVLASRIDPRDRGVALSVEQRIDLSAYLIRLRKYEEAIEVLRQAETEDRKNFMVLSNLGTANQLAGNMERAVSYLDQALGVWPNKLPGIPENDVGHYHAAEKYQRNLARLRALEARRQALRPGELPEHVDALFPVQFVGNGGRYEAGKLAADEKAKLPNNALQIVERLLTWMPDDWQLYRLYGEILNAQGSVPEAAQVFEQLSFSTRYQLPAEFVEHRRALIEAVDARKNSQGIVAGETPPITTEARKTESRGPVTSALTAAAVGALAGVVITALAFLQIREIRRRHQAAVKRQG